MAPPMTADQFVAALKAEGLDVRFPYADWRTHGRDAATGKPFGPVNGVVIHHTAGSNSLVVVRNGTGDLPGPLCHSHLPKTGRVNMISVHRANHAGTFAQNAHDAVVAESSVHPSPDAAEPVDGNDKYYGLEVENLGDGTDPYPWDQYVAAVKWATAICRFHDWSENSVIGHKEGTRRKIDPKGPVIGPDGNRFTLTMNRFRADVRAALALPAGAWATQEEDVALTQDDINKVARQTVTGAAGMHDPNDPAKDWALSSFVGRIYNSANRLEVEVAAVRAKVESLSVGGVDLDVLAVKVADEIYKRMAG